MTIKRFFLITFLQWGFLIAPKYYYFGEKLGQGDIANYFYFGAIIFITLVLTRRLGVISFLEGAFVAFFWLVFDAFLDLIITSSFLGTGIFQFWQLWAGYATMMLVVFLLHKKRHVEMRKKFHHH